MYISHIPTGRRRWSAFQALTRSGPCMFLTYLTLPPYSGTLPTCTCTYTYLTSPITPTCSHPHNNNKAALLSHALIVSQRGGAERDDDLDSKLLPRTPRAIQSRQQYNHVRHARFKSHRARPEDRILPTYLVSSCASRSSKLSIRAYCQRSRASSSE